MPKGASLYYNQIDIGIFMCFIELCLQHENTKYTRELFEDNQEYETSQLNCIYHLEK